MGRGAEAVVALRRPSWAAQIHSRWRHGVLRGSLGTQLPNLVGALAAGSTLTRLPHALAPEACPQEVCSFPRGPRPSSRLCSFFFSCCSFSPHVTHFTSRPRPTTLTYREGPTERPGHALWVFCTPTSSVIVILSINTRRIDAVSIKTTFVIQDLPTAFLVRN